MMEKVTFSSNGQWALIKSEKIWIPKDPRHNHPSYEESDAKTEQEYLQRYYKQVASETP